MLALADRCSLAGERLTLTGEGSVNAHLKIPALVAGMTAGADSIDDMDLLSSIDRLETGHASAHELLG